MKRKQGVVAVVLGVLLGWAVSAWAMDEVDINTASAAEMARLLSGIGQAKAAAIVAYREANGPFKSVDALIAVKGIGTGLLDRNRPHLVAKLPEPAQ